MHLLSIVGTHPQFVEAAMIADAVDRFNQRARHDCQMRHTLVHTRMHCDANVSERFFRELTVPEPKYSLGVRSGTDAVQTAMLLERIEGILCLERPDVLIVYGDAISTLGAALAAVKLQIPVAHVGAGLRSFNRQMPEEINRVLTDHTSSFLFCPTATAVENLKREGIVDGVFLTGDVMLDAVLELRARASGRSTVLRGLGIEWGSFILFAIHRPENTDSPERLSSLLETLLHVPYPIVFPVHPRTRRRIECDAPLSTMWRRIEAAPGIRAIDPVSYLEMLVLEENARIIVTDSGGIQKEAYFLGVPCITVRHETEWIETLRGGWNTLVSPDDGQALIHAAVCLWEMDGAGLREHANRSAFGQGRAADDIVLALAEQFLMRTGQAA